MEFQIKQAKLNADYNKKKNDIAARLQLLESGKHYALRQVDEDYHAKKRQMLCDIADIRKQKEGLAVDDPKRLALQDDIRNIEDLLNVSRDEADIERRKIADQTFADRIEIEEEGRRLNEWLEDEKIKLMEEQRAAKIAAIKEEFENLPEA